MNLAKQYARAIHRYRIATGGDRRRAWKALRDIATRALRRDTRRKAAP